MRVWAEQVWPLLSKQADTVPFTAASRSASGKITLADGAQVSGFLCEAYALVDAPEITHLGGWRGYIAQGV
jgi:allophanate hydrolase